MDDINDVGPVDVALCIDRAVFERLWEVIRHLCVGLVDLNARVRLLSSCAEVESLTLGPIQTLLHPEPVWPLRRQRLRQIIDRLSGRRPTVVHTLAGTSFWVGQAIARAFDVDLVVHLTAADDIRALQRLESLRVGHVIAASSPLHEMVCRSHAVDEAIVSIIRPGMLRSEAPTCFAQPGHVPTLLCTAALEPHAGAEQLLYAVRLLVDRGHRVLAFFAGGGAGEAELRGLVRRLNVSPWVTFAQPKAEAASVLSGADIWVSPAPERAIASSSLQAMATGTAVVACAGGVTDHCIDGQTAIVCADGEPETLADGIERLLTGRQRARDLALAGMAHIKEHHAVSRMADQVMSVYQRLSTRRRTFPLQK